jgi:hypothetical protein
MNTQEKKTLADAFRKAVESSPDADTPMHGFVIHDENNTVTPATQRKLMEATLASDEAFGQLCDQFEKAMKDNNLTFDQLITKAFKAPKP